jgi:hypothetical protein
MFEQGCEATGWVFEAAVVSCRNIPISNNVGSVKHFLSALKHALVEERHLALVGGLRVSNLGSLFIVGVRNSVRPSHLFDHPLRS